MESLAWPECLASSPELASCSSEDCSGTGWIATQDCMVSWSFSSTRSYINGLYPRPLFQFCVLPLLSWTPSSCSVLWLSAWHYTWWRLNQISGQVPVKLLWRLLWSSLQLLLNWPAWPTKSCWTGTGWWWLPRGIKPPWQVSFPVVLDNHNGLHDHNVFKTPLESHHLQIWMLWPVGLTSQPKSWLHYAWVLWWRTSRWWCLPFALHCGT